MNYRQYVGSKWDTLAAHAFGVMVSRGLLGCHSVLDVGCGSLRVGRLLMAYLERGNYTGIDPNEWLIQAAISEEMGQEYVTRRGATLRVSAGDSPDENRELGLFDFILLQSIFTHSSPSYISRKLSAMKAVSTKRTIILATFIEGDHLTPKTDWVYPGAVKYSRGQILDLCREKFVSAEVLPVLGHPGGHLWLEIKPCTNHLTI